jgi:RNA ligase
MNEPEQLFETFPKIPRWTSNGVITEKIDGTNAQIYIRKAATDESVVYIHRTAFVMVPELGGFDIFCGSRNRLITPDNDNFGFARWVKEHACELVKLGEGRHYGEWWGPGIQRGYGIPQKKFSLFNTARWNPQNPNKPECCNVVPILYAGEIGGNTVHDVLDNLRLTGSFAAPGFMNPEGVIVYLSNSRSYFKETYEHNKGKWAALAKVPVVEEFAEAA